MRNDCTRYEEGIVALAHGEPSPEAEAHVRTCDDCSRQLADLEQLIAELQTPTFDAPMAVVAAAKAIMPETRKVSIASLVFNSLSVAGARGSNEDAFQLVFESEDVRARLMYNPVQKGWEVLGRIESGGKWDARVAGKKVVVDQDGRFGFSAKSLDRTEMSLFGSDVDIIIPSAEEAREGGA